MIKLFFKYTRGVILERVPLTAGTVGLDCSFDFSDEWEGLTKTAVFEGSGVTKDVILLESTVKVPLEVLAEPDGELRIGVYGMDDDGNIVIPTMYVDVGTILGNSVDPSKDPTTDGTLPVWGQVLNVALEAKEKAENAEESATGEKESAREYAEAAEAAKTGAETAQEAAETAQDEAQAAKESIENMTVSAVMVAPGTDASVAKSESDGITHLEFSFPQADQANWDQEDSKSSSFVKSKPSIKAGTGTHAIVEGKITGNGANVASGLASHAEGYNTQATNQMAHAEGGDTVASGSASHAEGGGTKATAQYSHSEGRGTVANSNNQHVQGKFNDLTDSSKYAHIVGNGTGEDELNEDGTIKTKKRSNAHTLDWDGNAWFAGKVTVGTDNKELVTKAYVDESIENIEIDVDTEISDTSTNPVQNKVIKQYVDNSGGKSPYIGDNGNWFEWDINLKKYVDSGVQAQGEDGEPGVSGLPNIVTASSERMFITRCASYTEYRNTSSVTSAGINVFYRNINNPGNDMWAMTFTAGENISFMEPANEYQKIEWAVAEPVFTPGYTYYLSFIPLKDESYENDLAFKGTILGVWVAKELTASE